MPDKPFSFVDIETTGTNAIRGRIIEIGIVKTYNNKVIREYETLINPELRIDPFIEQMTGITSSELERAPLFSDIKEEIYGILDGSIFVAHNVRFDYGFIRNEFKRSGIDFKSKHFDTIKLARLLYPGHMHYNLDSIMDRFGIENKARHRAMGDAKVLWDFFKLSRDLNKKDVFENAMKLVLKKPSLPPSISRKTVEDLPESPGVYIFYGEEGSCLYIGKSINIKERVLSHFTNDFASNSDMRIVQTIKSLEHIETAGEFSALLLESTLIKKYKPIFNKVLRESRKMLVLVKKTNPKGYNSVTIKDMDQIKTPDIEKILAVYRSTKQLKDSLYEICKEFKLCPRLLGLEKGKGACFYCQLGYCSGACIGKEFNIKYNLRFDSAFFNKKVKTWKFDGPILIRENGLKSEIHLVDKWCYLGSVKDESQDINQIKRDYIFDFDTYKILKRFLNNPRNFLKVDLLRQAI